MCGNIPGEQPATRADFDTPMIGAQSQMHSQMATLMMFNDLIPSCEFPDHVYLTPTKGKAETEPNLASGSDQSTGSPQAYEMLAPPHPSPDLGDEMDTPVKIAGTPLALDEWSTTAEADSQSQIDSQIPSLENGGHVYLTPNQGKAETETTLPSGSTQSPSGSEGLECEMLALQYPSPDGSSGDEIDTPVKILTTDFQEEPTIAKPCSPASNIVIGSPIQVPDSPPSAKKNVKEITQEKAKPRERESTSKSKARATTKSKAKPKSKSTMAKTKKCIVMWPVYQSLLSCA